MLLLLHVRSVLVVVLISLSVFSTNSLHASSNVSNVRRNSYLTVSSEHVANGKTPNLGKASGSLQQVRHLEDTDPGFDPLGFVFAIVGGFFRAVQSVLSFLTLGVIPPPVDPEPPDTVASTRFEYSIRYGPLSLEEEALAKCLVEVTVNILQEQLPKSLGEDRRRLEDCICDYDVVSTLDRLTDSGELSAS